MQGAVAIAKSVSLSLRQSAHTPLPRAFLFSAIFLYFLALCFLKKHLSKSCLSNLRFSDKPYAQMARLRIVESLDGCILEILLYKHSKELAKLKHFFVLVYFLKCIRKTFYTILRCILAYDLSENLCVVSSFLINVITSQKTEC